MVPIGLCLLALICVALGLAMTNAAWLFAAVALTVLALGALAQRRVSVGRLHRTPASLSDDADEPVDDLGEPIDDAVWVIDGRPRYHARDCVLVKEWDAVPIERAQAVEDAFVPCAVCRPDEQQPEPHLSGRDQEG